MIEILRELNNHNFGGFHIPYFDKWLSLIRLNIGRNQILKSLIERPLVNGAVTLRY